MADQTLTGLRAGVLHGDEVQALFQHAKANAFAMPAVNVTGTNTVNAVLETAKSVNSPVMVQFSNGGAQFFAGKSVSNDGQRASIAGGISGALHVHHMAELYDVPVVLHTDHAAKKLLPWIDGLLDAGEKYFARHGQPLYSSHMLDLSEEPIEENIEICKRYLERMAKIGMTLEIELGVTGGEEDGVDNTDVDSSKLYTQPSEVAFAYKELSEVSPRFTIAAAFGNVHGVYKPGNVQLRPELLGEIQAGIAAKYGTAATPLDLVFHGGSGSTDEEIATGVANGVIKMNIDTDTQYAFSRSIADTVLKNYDGFLKVDGEVGNKKVYDPRAWGKTAESAMALRVIEATKQLGSAGHSGN